MIALAILAVIVAAVVSALVATRIERTRLAGGAVDPLLRAAELEVEELLGAGAMGVRDARGGLTLYPAQHPRLTELQRRAIAGLLRAGVSIEGLRELKVDGINPPTTDKPARWHEWNGWRDDNGKRCDSPRGERPGRWSETHAISPTNWAYLRRVIANLPKPDCNWAFQYRDGSQVSYADMLGCAGDDDRDGGTGGATGAGA